MDSFAAAVDWMAIASRDYVHRGQLVLPRTEPRRAIHMLNLGIFWMPHDDDGAASKSSGNFICSAEAADMLLQLAHADGAAFDLLVEMSVHRLATFSEFPPALRAFVVGHMSGNLKRPKQRRKTVTWLRNLYLLTMARTIAYDFSLKLTRADETKLTRADETSGRQSACDAVSAGLERNGHHLTYRAVKELCVGSGKENIELRKEYDEWVRATAFALENFEPARKLFNRSWLGVGVNLASPS